MLYDKLTNVHQASRLDSTGRPGTANRLGDTAERRVAELRADRTGYSNRAPHIDRTGRGFAAERRPQTGGRRGSGTTADPARRPRPSDRSRPHPQGERPDRGRPPRRRGGRLSFLLVCVVIAAIAGAAGTWLRLRHPTDSEPRAAGGSSSAAASKPTTRPKGFANQRAAPATSPTSTGRFRFADGTGPALGNGTHQYRYRVAVEDGSGIDIAEFTSLVDKTLGDSKSWIADGTLRLQRVGEGAAADFTVHLATPATAEQLCLSGGITTIIDGVPYTSCRVGGKVVVNLDRYLNGVPNYGADLSVYRQYVINHEVGHALGHGHEGCPGAGRPGPVMLQQTLSLAGCVANPWPYIDGKLYSGPPLAT